LFAVDTGDGLSQNDCAGITRFRERGGGLLVTRDHQDLGSSVCTLGGVGRAHYFHTRNPDPDPARCRRDDQATTAIDWPNYHSGSNGDYQHIHVAQPAHPLMQRTAAAGDVIEFFPAHPHEGAVGVPEGEQAARVIATGVSTVSGRSFNLLVAFERARDERGHMLGRGIAESSFHHLLDYNWDINAGCPRVVVVTYGFSLEYHGRDALVDEFFLRPEFRGRGVGRQALEFVAEFCRAQDISAVHLAVDHANERAQRVYRQFGFEQHERFIMTKWLDKEE
jgi:ribosomal protein S18 acetylase RimI-like enzyme